jgi:hypothetical protein
MLPDILGAQRKGHLMRASGKHGRLTQNERTRSASGYVESEHGRQRGMLPDILGAQRRGHLMRASGKHGCLMQNGKPPFCEMRANASLIHTRSSIETTPTPTSTPDRGSIDRGANALCHRPSPLTRPSRPWVPRPPSLFIAPWPI